MNLKESIFGDQTGDQPSQQREEAATKTKRRGPLSRFMNRSASVRPAQTIQFSGATTAVKRKHSVVPLAKRTGTIYTDVMVPLDPPAAAAIWAIMTAVIIALSGWTVMGKVIIHGLPWAAPLVVVEILLFDLMRKLHSRYNGGVALIGLIVSGIVMLALLGLFFVHTDTLERVAAGWYFSLFLTTPGPLVALKWKETWRLAHEKLLAQNEAERLAIEREKSEVQADRADAQRNLEQVSRLAHYIGEVSDRANSTASTLLQTSAAAQNNIAGLKDYVDSEIVRRTNEQVAIRTHALNNEGAAMKQRLQESFAEEVDKRAAANVAEARAETRRAEEEIERLKQQLLQQRYTSPEPSRPMPAPQVILPDGSAAPGHWVDPGEE